jgi:hypothetical protein
MSCFQPNLVSYFVLVRYLMRVPCYPIDGLDRSVLEFQQPLHPIFYRFIGCFRSAFCIQSCLVPKEDLVWRKSCGCVPSIIVYCGGNCQPVHPVLWMR